MTVCKVCGRRLTDPESVKRRVGPVCHRKTRNLEEGKEEEQ